MLKAVREYRANTGDHMIPFNELDYMQSAIWQLWRRHAASSGWLCFWQRQSTTDANPAPLLEMAALLLIFSSAMIMPSHTFVLH